MDVVMHNAALDQNCSFCRLPSTVLENIALETCVVDPLGPPSDLIPLLLTCKHVYVQLAFLYNRHFYARIFRAKFDTRAASRRLGSRASYTANLANQLRIWCQCLTHIKRGDIMSSQTPKFLWAAFFMMVESDGKNEAQLLEWADLKTFVDRFVRERLWESRDEYHGWPAESSVNALALWLMWLTTDEETLKNESPEARRKLMELVRPYVVLPLRYPSFHAPDNHFDFPLPQDMRERLPYTHLTPHGFYPPYRKPETLAITHLHFNVRLEISVPPITIAAKLLYFARSEATPFDFPTNLPVDRAAAIAAGYLQPMPTQADYRQFNEHKGAKVLERGDWDWRSKMDEEEGKLEDDGFWRKGLKAKSARWDNDWQRWCYCFDPWQTPYLKGVVYTYGSLNGDWMGRMLIPDMNQYFGMATSMTFAPQVPSMTTLPISLRLREYHCINPEHPVAPGGSSYDILDDGISNGWFPNDLNIRELPTGARAENPNYGGSVSWYEMYREGKPNSHSEETCTQCQFRKEQEEEALQERVRAHKRASEEISPDDSDDEQRGRAGGGDGDEQGTGSSHQRARRNRQTSPSMQRHLHEHGHGERQPGVTTPDGPGSGVDPNAGLRIEISESLGQDVDALLDEEMGSVDEEDDVEYWEEYMENTCHGIQDIIITGETIHSHGQAWQHYVYYGRVRRWDGLIALVRKPKFVTELGIAIFRGYLVGNQNLVGNWRAFTVNPHAIPLEGPFVASRSFTEEQ